MIRDIYSARINCVRAFDACSRRKKTYIIQVQGSHWNAPDAQSQMEVLMAINGSHTQMTSTIGNRHVLCSLGWVWRMGNGAPPAIAHKSHSFINLLAQSCDQELEECRKYENMFYLNRITLLLCRPIIDLTGIGRNETNAKNALWVLCVCAVWTQGHRSELPLGIRAKPNGFLSCRVRARAHTHTLINDRSLINLN